MFYIPIIRRPLYSKKSKGDITQIQHKLHTVYERRLTRTHLSRSDLKSCRQLPNVASLSVLYIKNDHYSFLCTYSMTENDSIQATDLGTGIA